MKKIVALLLVALIAAAFFGCGYKEGDLGEQTSVNSENSYTIYNEVRPYDHTDDEESFKDSTDTFRSEPNELKVSRETEGIKPIETKDDVITIAFKEVSVDFNTVHVYFDRTQGFWKVVFSDTEETTNADGIVTQRDIRPKESVYVDEDGYTFLCVVHK